MIIKVTTYVNIDETKYSLSKSRIREIVKESINFGDVQDYWKDQIAVALTYEQDEGGE